jgi:2',3'-cyclic-nucleotide 2'-phosphodiesterase/3'-nucleotidase/5'-nucleotidase
MRGTYVTPIVYPLLALLAGCTQPTADEDAVAGEDALYGGWGAPPELTLVGRFQGDGGFDAEVAMIVAFDRHRDRLLVTNKEMQRIDLIDIDDPDAPVAVGSYDVTPYGHHATSVAVGEHGLVAAAVVADDPQAPGKLVFFRPNGTVAAAVTVGALPDMVTFTPNGKYALVANEGEPNDDYTVDPEGSISIVYVGNGCSPIRQSDVKTADFHAYEGALPAGVRVFGPGATASQDLEPEYIAVSEDSRTAFVTLQENNALAIVDIRHAEIDDIVPLGLQDHMAAGHGLDASDKDSSVHIANWPVKGMYQPDSLARFSRWGETYLVSANEGDARDYDGLAEGARVSTLTLDPTVFPNASTLKTNANLGRLTVSKSTGDLDHDGDFDEIHAFGGRSFSIWDEDGNLVWDSGDQLEQLTSAALPTQFNANNDSNASFDTRSDNSGPEPEGVAVGKVRGRTYAFIGLERVGGIAVFDVTTPWAPTFVQYLVTRDFAGDPAAGTGGDLAPEGMLFIPAIDSPTHDALLVVSYELSGTTAIYEFD